MTNYLDDLSPEGAKEILERCIKRYGLAEVVRAMRISMILGMRNNGVYIELCENGEIAIVFTSLDKTTYVKDKCLGEVCDIVENKIVFSMN